MAVVVVVGAQWGDEGKGKVVDLYTPSAGVVVRYGGGANAGHTLVVGDEKVVFHLVPSGALHEKTLCILGQGTVIDPRALLEEFDELKRRNLLSPSHLLVAHDAFVVLPHHREIDALRESVAGQSAIGTTRRGIGPAYEDKVARRGIRIVDLFDETRLRAKLERNIEAWRPWIESLGVACPDAAKMAAEYAAYGATIRPFAGDAASALHKAIDAGTHVLLEGAQGTLLDLDHGTYPFVTSSTVTAAGACTGTGIGPRAIDHVVGITKAYATRVGEGPFPTELAGDEQTRLREAGDEFGATTGRPRRCGWLDLPALRYAVRVNGIDSLAITKLDVLSGLDELKVCTGYEIDGKATTEFATHTLSLARPVWKTLPGFKSELRGVRRFEDLPEAARDYLRFIESHVSCPIGLVSVGPGRDETIVLRDPFGDPRAWADSMSL